MLVTPPDAYAFEAVLSDRLEYLSRSGTLCAIPQLVLVDKAAFGDSQCLGVGCRCQYGTLSVELEGASAAAGVARSVRALTGRWSAGT